MKQETALARQRGFTLLEVLVALLIVSIGLIGLAGLMSTSLKNNQGASQRSQATWLTYDLLDRMRANRTAALGGSYNTTSIKSYSGSGSVAATDLTQWKAELANALPGSDAVVTVAGNLATVNIQWDDRRGLGLAAGGFYGSSTLHLTINSQL